MRVNIAKIGSVICVMAVCICCVSFSAKAFTSNGSWIIGDPETTLTGDYPLINYNGGLVNIASTTGYINSSINVLICHNPWIFSDPVYNWNVSQEMLFNAELANPKIGLSDTTWNNLALYFVDMRQLMFDSRTQIHSGISLSPGLNDVYSGTASYNGHTYTFPPGTIIITVDQLAEMPRVPLNSLKNYTNIPHDIGGWANISTDTNNEEATWWHDVPINDLAIVVGPYIRSQVIDATEGTRYSVDIKPSLYLQNGAYPSINVGMSWPLVNPIPVTTGNSRVNELLEQDSLTGTPAGYQGTKQTLQTQYQNASDMTQWDTDLGFSFENVATYFIFPWMIKIFLLMIGFGVMGILIRRSLHD